VSAGPDVVRPPVARDRGAGTLRARWIAGAVVLAGLFVWVESRTLVELWRVWTTNDNYSHGPLVPIATVVLAWRRRAVLAAQPLRPSGWGIALVGAACALQVLGLRADVFALQGASVVMLIAGLVLAFCGPAVTRVLAFPLAFLLFMLPFPPFVVNTVSFWLKEITVRLSTAWAELLGVTLQRSGMTLFLASGELHMENPCSGLRSLVSLLATGALFAHLQPGGRVRRAIMLVAAVPIAMLGNAVRTTLLIVVAHYASVAAVEGGFHDASGLLVYGVALAAMLGLRRLLTPAPPGTAAVSRVEPAR
jgi:exosortase